MFQDFNAMIECYMPHMINSFVEQLGEDGETYSARFERRAKEIKRKFVITEKDMDNFFKTHFPHNCIDIIVSFYKEKGIDIYDELKEKFGGKIAYSVLNTFAAYSFATAITGVNGEASLSIDDTKGVFGFLDKNKIGDSDARDKFLSFFGLTAENLTTEQVHLFRDLAEYSHSKVLNLIDYYKGMQQKFSEIKAKTSPIYLEQLRLMFKEVKNFLPEEDRNTIGEDAGFDPTKLTSFALFKSQGLPFEIKQGESLISTETSSMVNSKIGKYKTNYYKKALKHLILDVDENYEVTNEDLDTYMEQFYNREVDGVYSVDDDTIYIRPYSNIYQFEKYLQHEYGHAFGLNTERRQDGVWDVKLGDEKYLCESKIPVDYNEDYCKYVIGSRCFNEARVELMARERVLSIWEKGINIGIKPPVGIVDAFASYHEEIDYLLPILSALPKRSVKAQFDSDLGELLEFITKEELNSLDQLVEQKIEDGQLSTGTITAWPNVNLVAREVVNVGSGQKTSDWYQNYTQVEDSSPLDDAINQIAENVKNRAAPKSV